jgi:hypothetical protein
MCAVLKLSGTERAQHRGINPLCLGGEPVTPVGGSKFA